MKSLAIALSLFTLTAYAAELTGKYTDDHGGTHLISSTAWTMKGDGAPSTFVIMENRKNFIIAHNAEKNPFHPGKFSRFDFVKQPGGAIIFCQTVADAETKEAAEKHAPANPRAKDGKGCGGFPFSILKRTVAKVTPVEPAEDSDTVSGQ